MKGASCRPEESLTPIRRLDARPTPVSAPYRAEVMVRAELLVNGDTVTRGDGGFVEYYQILFDNHEFIFAEGIATESLTLDVSTSAALPREVCDRLGIARPAKRGPRAFEIVEGMLDSAIAADVLRRASAL